MTISLKLESLERCPLCGNSKNLRTVLTTHDFESNTGKYSIQECPECSMAFTNPRPKEESIPLLYSGRATPDFAVGNHGITQKLRDFVIRRYLDKHISFKERPLHVLDFGCGDGSLTHCAAHLADSRRSSAHITAVDFHEQPPALIHGGLSSVRYLSYQQWRQANEEYDVVFLRNVLEHHPEPVRLLQEISGTLKENGAVHIEVPNRRSIWASIFVSYYSMHYVPRHFVHFDECSLRQTIHKAGMRVTGQSYGHSPCIPLSIGHLLAKRLDNVSLLGLLTFPIQFLLDFVLGRSTTLRISAKK